MPPSPIFYNQNLAHIIVNGKDKYYLDSPEVTLKPTDTIELSGVFAYNAGDYGYIGMGIYVYDKDSQEIRCIAWGEGYYDNGDLILMNIYDRTKWKAAELCFFEKSVEIRVVSWYWDDKKSKWIENDYLIYAHDSQIEYGFKVKVERKCCDIFCLSRAKVFKVKVEDEYGNPVEDAKVELCFNSSCTCSSTDPGYESHKTDKNGEVWIEKCGPGLFDSQDLAIVISKSGYTTMYHCKKWSDISDCDIIRLLLPTLITTDITITVLDSVTNQPVERAKVELYEYLFGTLVDTKYTNSYGKAEFKNLDSSMTYYVVIRKDCYKKYQSDTFFPSDKTFKITGYKHCFRVKVVDESDNPLEGANVEIRDSNRNLIASDTTDSSGLTKLFMTDEDPLVLVITKTPYSEREEVIKAPEGSGGETIKYVLYEQKEKGIEVTIQDIYGNPVHDFMVSYKKITEWKYQAGCLYSPFHLQNKCVIKDVPYGEYFIEAVSASKGTDSLYIRHQSERTSVTAVVGAPSYKARVKFRVCVKENEKYLYPKGASITLECEDIGYKETLITDEHGEADFGEIYLGGKERTFHYKIAYAGFPLLEGEETFSEQHSYVIEKLMEKAFPLDWLIIAIIILLVLLILIS